MHQVNPKVKGDQGVAMVKKREDEHCQAKVVQV